MTHFSNHGRPLLLITSQFPAPTWSIIFRQSGCRTRWNCVCFWRIKWPKLIVDRCCAWGLLDCQSQDSSVIGFQESSLFWTCLLMGRLGKCCDQLLIAKNTRINPEISDWQAVASSEKCQYKQDGRAVHLPSLLFVFFWSYWNGTLPMVSMEGWKQIGREIQSKRAINGIDVELWEILINGPSVESFLWNGNWTGD